jgi:hydrogenase-4 component F
MMEQLSAAGLVVLAPLLGAVVVAALPWREVAGWLGVAVAIATFALACRLPWELGARPWVLIDAPAAHFAILAGFVAIPGAWFGRTGGRAAQAVFHLLLALTLVALLSNNIGVTWLCIGAGVVGMAVAIGLKLTAEAVADAFRFFLPCGTGVALALFGIVAMFLAARASYGGFTWSGFGSAGGVFDGGLLNLGYVLVLIGFGTIVALAPMGIISLAPLLVMLRMRAMLARHPEAIAPGPLLMAIGIAALLLSVIFLIRRDPARAFLGQAGIALFAFGLGTPAGVFAGLLQLTLLTLTRAALSGERPGLVGIAALAGLPPFGLFASSFLVLMATVAAAPWLALPLGLGMIALAWALLGKAEKTRPAGLVELAPVWALLAVTAWLGIAMPAPVAGWFAMAAEQLQ